VSKTISGEVRKSDPLVLEGITITHPERVISDIGHITKGELAEYYSAVASRILPQIARHPLSLLRCPSGIDKPCFFQRNPGKGLGADVYSNSTIRRKRMNTCTSRTKEDYWK
jgi:DNA primase